MKWQLLLAALLLFISCARAEDVLRDRPVFFPFERPEEIWNLPKTPDNAVTGAALSEEKAAEGKSSLALKVVFPGEGIVEKEFFKDFSKYRNLCLDVFAPAGVPADLKIQVFIQDGEWLWYQTPLFTLREGRWNRLTLDIRPASPLWENIGHTQPWTTRTVSAVRKIGIKLFSKSPYTGTLYLDNVSGELVEFPEYDVSSREIPRFGLFEIAFNLPDRYLNPFDPAEIAVDGFFLTRPATAGRSPVSSIRNTAGS